MTDMDIVKMKLKFIIEYFSSHISYKNKIKKMMGSILDVASQTKEEKKTVKNIGHLKIMLKHCDMKDIHPFLTETIYSAIFPDEKWLKLKSSLWTIIVFFMLLRFLFFSMNWPRTRSTVSVFLFMMTTLFLFLWRRSFFSFLFSMLSFFSLLLSIRWISFSAISWFLFSYPIISIIIFSTFRFISEEFIISLSIFPFSIWFG